MIKATLGTGLVIGAVIGATVYTVVGSNPHAWLSIPGVIAGALNGGIEASLSPGGDYGDVMLGAGIGAVFGAICPSGAIGSLVGGLSGAALAAYALGGDQSTIATAYQWGSLVGGLTGDFTGGVLTRAKTVTMRAAIGWGLWHVGADLAGAGVGAAVGYYAGDRTAASALHGANLGMMAGGVARGLWGSKRAVDSIGVLDDAAKAQGKVVGSFKIDLTNPPPQGWRYWTTPYSPKFANPRIVDPITGIKVPTSALGSKTGLHELQHFLDATQHPQLYYFARVSNAPGAGLAHFVYETRGYLQSHGLQALYNPLLAMASVRHAKRAHLVYRDLAGLVGLGGIGGVAYWFTSTEGKQQ